MSDAASSSVWYVYGIVPEDMSATVLPRGLDDADVAVERYDGVAALVSELDGERYAPGVLETTTGDVEWLSPRAIAHDGVLTWASDRGAVIPLPMFSIFSSREAVRAMLADRSAQLVATLARVAVGREYALRVYRVDAELLEAVVSLSPRLKEMAGVAAAASPGQRYLLERKLEGEKKSEMRSVTARIVEEIASELGLHAREVARPPIPRADAATTAAARGTMVLNGAFLVTAAQLEEFQRTLTSLVVRHGSHGFRFDFTGPWPPYHFVEPQGGSDHGA